MKALTQGEIRPFNPAGVRPANLSPHVFNFGSSSLCLSDDGYLVAWIYPGHYLTQRHHKQFWDVAYIKPCSTKAGDMTGFMLDSECFDTEAEALAFVATLTGGAA